MNADDLDDLQCEINLITARADKQRKREYAQRVLN